MHKCNFFYEIRSGRDVLDTPLYDTVFQLLAVAVGGFLRVRLFPPPLKRSATI